MPLVQIISPCVKPALASGNLRFPAVRLISPVVAESAFTPEPRAERSPNVIALFPATVTVLPEPDVLTLCVPAIVS